MKKTDKTALTAAIFAAAMGAAAVSGTPAEAAGISPDNAGLASQLESFAPVYGPAPDFDDTDPTEAPVTKSIEELEELQDVYGPPVTGQIMTRPAKTTATTVAVTEVTTLPEFQEVYGPPPVDTPTEAVTEAEEMMATVYGPPAMSGDINYDSSIDSFDLVKLRSIVTGEEMPTPYGGQYSADVNGDGEINIADLVSMGRYLIGQTDSLTSKKIKKNKIKVIYQEENIEPATEEETNPIDILPQPKYGPPYSGDIDDPSDPIEDPTYQVVYGPPSYFGLEDF